MKLYKKLAAAFAATALALPAVAQSYSGYFDEGYNFRHQLNPAFGNEVNFVGTPALSDMNVGFQGNLSLRDVFFNVDGRTTLFTNPGVSTDEFMRYINKNNELNAHVKMTILSGGFKAWGGYNTVSINAHVDAFTRMPKSLFSFLKEGVSNQHYDLSDVRARALGYVDLSLGHSRQIGSKWRVGANLKLLFGGAYMSADVERADLNLADNEWIATTNANVQTSVKGFYYKTKYDRHNHRDYVNGGDIDGGGIAGMGAAIDLGTEFRPNQNWAFSAAVLDFGFIHWNNNIVASTNGDRTINTDAYTFSADSDADNSFKNEWLNVRDQLTSLYELDNNGDEGGRTTMLGATINVGAEYTLPAYRKLSFGLLNSTFIYGKWTTTNFRLSANIAPVKVFSANANLNVGTYGAAMGWLLNFHPKVFNLYIGMDHTFARIAKQGVPLASNATFNMGINWTF